MGRSGFCKTRFRRRDRNSHASSLLSQPEPDFAPGSVGAGWREESLFLFAKLTDADIFTRATRHNQRMWDLGDAFEIFLRPETQEAYSEFHVTPNNLHLQLHFADAQSVRQLAVANSFENAMVDEVLFESAVWVRPEEKCWQISARIPAASIFLEPRQMLGAIWHFSFSRYDYTRGRSKPVISSTSAHLQPRFHEQSEWGVLQFER